MDRERKKRKLQQKGSAFTNQKQLGLGSNENVEIQHLSGDMSTDNRIDIDDTENNLEFRESMPAGGPFMHPMHDATADPQLDNKNRKRKSRR